jgi:pyruvate ferredoxin oxidoreductase beta subunit
VAAHGIPYAATASVGYLEDYMRKVEKASRIRGTKFIHVLAPCPTGWGIKTDMTVDIAKQAVDTGLWQLAEYENGEFKLNMGMKKPGGLSDYIRSQKRFAHLADDDIGHVIEVRDARWDKYY